MTSADGRVRLLLVAYGCRPNAGSEHSIGWSWLRSLSTVDWLDVTLVTAASNLEFLQDRPETAAVEMIGVDDDPNLPRLLPGELNETMRYFAFCRRGGQAVEELGPRFDLAHHVSWGNVRVASPAFSAECPLILGPVGGGQQFPKAFGRYLGSARRIEHIRNLEVALNRHRPRVKKNLSNAALVIVTNLPTRDFAIRAGARRTEVMTDIGNANFTAVARASSAPDTDQTSGESPRLRVIWVGRLLPRKAVELAIEAVEKASDRIPIELTIVGDGPQADIVRAHERHPSITWVGQVPYEELADLYGRHDCLLYSSLRDSGSPPMAEAVAMGLPAIYVDHHGPNVYGRGGWAIGVEPTTVDETVDGLADAMVRFASDPELRDRLSANCKVAAGSNAERARLATVLAWYREVLEGS